jgi:hypothetical protein
VRGASGCGTAARSASEGTGRLTGGNARGGRRLQLQLLLLPVLLLLRTGTQLGDDGAGVCTSVRVNVNVSLAVDGRWIVT